MSIELKVPPVGESITDAELGDWLKAEGDWIPEDEPLLVIETDKVTVELPAPVSGVLTRIVKQTGDSVQIGEVVGYMEEAAEATGDAAAPAAKSAGETPATEARAAEAPAGAATASDTAAGDTAAGDTAAGDTAAGDTEARITPAARRALAEAGLEASQVQTSGPGGRLLKEDVQRHVEAAPATKSAPTSKPAATGSTPAATGSRHEEAVRMSPLRKRVAQRLLEAQQGAALLTTFNEIDMSAVMALRKSYKEPFLDKHEVKLGFMSFFVKAVIEALKEVPGVNSEIRGEEVIYRNYYDIGVAVGGGKGLVVPVIRNAERLSFAGVEKTIGDLALRARKNKLKLEELQGGTFTISNGGIYGSLLSTPIVNPPQSGILGLHKIEERPIALKGEVVIRPMMYVALTYDHRVVDGREAVTFLVRVKERIEDPSRILLEV